MPEVGKSVPKQDMETRNQFLARLIPLTNLPEDVEAECPICAEDFIEPVQLCETHIFCHGCAIKWLTRKKRNTCPTCRRVLFDPAEVDRWSFGADRLPILAKALENSGLLGSDFDRYGFDVCTTAEVQRAAAATNSYLAQDHHAPVTDASRVCIDMRILGPHIIAMGNMLRAVAGATNRGYSEQQRRDWKLIIERLLRFLSQWDGQFFDGGDLVYMAQDLRLGTLRSLRAENIDVRSSRFFEIDAPLDSPSGDLDFLLDYIVFQEMIEFEQRVMERETYQQAQRLALQDETTTMGYVLRWTRQRMFNLM